MSSAADLDLQTLDVISPEHYERSGYPHAEWTYLRKHAPVYYFDRGNYDPFWAITKHRDIVEIGKNPADWIIQPRLSVFARDVPVEVTPLRHLLSMDPPEHRDYRAVTAKWFTPRMTQQWAPKVARKIVASGELYAKLVGTISTPEKFEANRARLAQKEWARMKRNDSLVCRNCHSTEGMSPDKQNDRAKERHAKGKAEGRTCIDCHFGIAHNEPEGPGPQELFDKKK